MIFPIQSVMLPGRMENTNTSAKKISENKNSIVCSESCVPKRGLTPAVKEVVAHRGIAKNGPIVR